jgi:hypothetical protein
MRFQVHQLYEHCFLTALVSSVGEQVAENQTGEAKWLSWMGEQQPRLLVSRGRCDLTFEATEREAYRRDVPNAEMHILDAGHFRFDTVAEEIGALVQRLAGGTAPALTRQAG